MSFEPFFNYEQISEEMAHELRDALKQLRDAQEDLLSAEDAEGVVTCARSVVEAQNEIMITHKAINRYIYTFPAMVHVAGEPKLEFDDGRPVYVQRCERCASELCRSDREDDEYFGKGESVGKADLGEANATYLLGERERYDHEFECVSFKEIFGDS